MRKTHNKQPYPDNLSALNLPVSINSVDDDNGTIRSRRRRSGGDIYRAGTSQSSPKISPSLKLPHIVEPELEADEKEGIPEIQITAPTPTTPSVKLAEIAGSEAGQTTPSEEEYVAKLFMEQYPASQPTKFGLGSGNSDDDIGLLDQTMDATVSVPKKRSTTPMSTTSTDSTSHSQISFTTALHDDLGKPPTPSVKDLDLSPPQQACPSHQFSIPRKVSTFFRTTFTPLHLQPSAPSLKSFFRTPHAKSPTNKPYIQPHITTQLRAETIPAASFVPPMHGRARASSNPLQPNPSILSMVLAPWSGNRETGGEEFGVGYPSAGLNSASCEDLRLGATVGSQIEEDNVEGAHKKEENDLASSRTMKGPQVGVASLLDEPNLRRALR